MSRASVRLRVAVAAALGVLAAVAVLGGATQFLVRHELRASQDRGLRGRASDLARLSLSAPALLTAPGALDAPYGGQDLLVEVLDAKQRIIARSAALGGRLLGVDPLVRAAVRDGRTAYGSTRLSGEPVRLFVAPLPAAARVGGGGAVVVASSEREILRTADHVRTLILLCALAAAGLGAVAAAALTGRVLAPLRRLTAAAAAIERTGDASHRLPAGEARGNAGGEIGELTRTLNAMLAALDAARESERRFLADASHELRTPITALRGNVEFLARHGSDAETLTDVRADVHRLARLVDDLLALERHAQAGEPHRPVVLGDVARSAVAGLERPVAVDVPAPVVVAGDEDALRRAIANLAANALVHGRDPVTVSVRRAGERARIEVADAGPGLAAADAEAAFGRFWRGADAGGRPGSGLGLAIVRATARAHGGDAWADGATFTIDLPAAGDSEGEQGPEIVRGSSESPPTVDDIVLPS